MCVWGGGGEGSSEVLVGYWQVRADLSKLWVSISIDLT